jgi:hypothetical protein
MQAQLQAQAAAAAAAPAGAAQPAPLPAVPAHDARAAAAPAGAAHDARAGRGRGRGAAAAAASSVPSASPDAASGLLRAPALPDRPHRIAPLSIAAAQVNAEERARQRERALQQRMAALAATGSGGRGATASAGAGGGHPDAATAGMLASGGETGTVGAGRGILVRARVLAAARAGAQGASPASHQPGGGAASASSAAPAALPAPAGAAPASTVSERIGRLLVRAGADPREADVVTGLSPLQQLLEGGPALRTAQVARDWLQQAAWRRRGWLAGARWRRAVHARAQRTRRASLEEVALAAAVATPPLQQWPPQHQPEPHPQQPAVKVARSGQPSQPQVAAQPVAALQ